MERFVDIRGYEGQYQIGTHGSVKSLERIKKVSKYNPNVLLPETFLKSHRDTGGYPYISLLKDGKKKRFRIHKLVASHFIPGYKPELDVNHRDGNKGNNTVQNLEMCSRSQNLKHAYDTGLKKPTTKINAEIAYEIKYGLKGIPQRIIAEKYDLFQTTISGIRTGKTWKHI